METIEEASEKLKKKIASYSHWPSTKKLGDKLMPFTESGELVFLLADIVKNERWDEFPQFNPREYTGFCAMIYVFIHYILRQKENCRDIISALEYTTEKAVEVVMNDGFDNKYYMLRFIYGMYKKEKNFPRELFKKFDVVPGDKLRFTSIGDTYSVGAYSTYTCGQIKIPPMYNGKPISEISGQGFSSSGITGVELPEGIEEIGGSAFSNSKIKSIKLPQSLKTVGPFAFSGCPKLTGDIIIPKGVVKIRANIFAWTEISNILVEGYTEKPDGWDRDWSRKTTLNSDDEVHNIIWNYSL